MRRDRMATVLRVRELVERQRLAEQATALRQVAHAEQTHERACRARDAADLTPGTSMVPRQLMTARLGRIALGEGVERAVTGQRDAERVAADAERALVAAAIERRSAQRLRDRRAAAVAHDEARVETRRADEVALQQWRSQR